MAQRPQQARDTAGNQQVTNHGVNANVVHGMTINQGGSSVVTRDTVKLKVDTPSENGLSSFVIELPWGYFKYPSREETDKAISTTAATAMEHLVRTLGPVQTTANKRKRDDDSGPSKHKRAKRQYPFKPNDECEYINLCVRCYDQDDWRRDVFLKKTQNLYRCLEVFMDESDMVLTCLRLFYGDNLIDNGDTAEDVGFYSLFIV